MCMCWDTCVRKCVHTCVHVSADGCVRVSTLPRTRAPLLVGPAAEPRMSHGLDMVLGGRDAITRPQDAGRPGGGARRGEGEGLGLC